MKRMSSCNASGASRSIFSSQSVMKVSEAGGKYQRRIHHGTFLRGDAADVAAVDARRLLLQVGGAAEHERLAVEHAAVRAGCAGGERRCRVPPACSSAPCPSSRGCTSPCPTRCRKKPRSTASGRARCSPADGGRRPSSTRPSAGRRCAAEPAPDSRRRCRCCESVIAAEAGPLRPAHQLQQLADAALRPRPVAASVRQRFQA